MSALVQCDISSDCDGSLVEVMASVPGAQVTVGFIRTETFYSARRSRWGVEGTEEVYHVLDEYREFVAMKRSRTEAIMLLVAMSKRNLETF